MSRSKPNNPRRPWKAKIVYNLGSKDVYRRTLTFASELAREQRLASWPGLVTVQRINPDPVPEADPGSRPYQVT